MLSLCKWFVKIKFSQHEETESDYSLLCAEGSEDGSRQEDFLVNTNERVWGFLGP